MNGVDGADKGACAFMVRSGSRGSISSRTSKTSSRLGAASKLEGRISESMLSEDSFLSITSDTLDKPQEAGDRQEPSKHISMELKSDDIPLSTAEHTRIGLGGIMLLTSLV